VKTPNTRTELACASTVNEASTPQACAPTPTGAKVCWVVTPPQALAVVEELMTSCPEEVAAVPVEFFAVQLTVVSSAAENESGIAARPAC
jgi:hypothetical protein